MTFVVHIHEVNAFFVRHASSLNAGAVAASILQTDTRKSTLPHQLQHRLDLHRKCEIQLSAQLFIRARLS